MTMPSAKVGLGKMKEAIVAASAAGLNAVSQGERLSLIWTWPGMSVSFNLDNGKWFWVAFDSREQRSIGCGRAATIAAAVDQARMATKAPLLAAE